MAGYAKSVVFPSSSTLPELAIALFGGKHPELAYKLYVLVSAAIVPWLLALACRFWRISSAGTAIALTLFLIYVWTDFPISYVQLGMLPYFLGIPLALAATGAFARFLSFGAARQLVGRDGAHEPGASGSFHDRDGGGAGRLGCLHCRRSSG